MGRLFVISGSSGVGKGTLIKKFLAKHPDFKLSVSCTTRSPRNGEENGKDYFFITREEFEKAAQNNEFLEHEEFSGNIYGTKKAYVEKKLAEGKNLILEIDSKGALSVKSIMPEATLIFILPPSLEELEARLRGRNTESEEAIQKRLAETKSEIENSKNYDYTVVNDDIDSALLKLESIMCSNKNVL